MREYLTHYGRDSQVALHGMAALSPLFDRPLSPTLVTLVWELPRPHALASSFEGDSATSPPGRELVDESGYEELTADLAEIEREKA